MYSESNLRNKMAVFGEALQEQDGGRNTLTAAAVV